MRLELERAPASQLKYNGKIWDRRNYRKFFSKIEKGMQLRVEDAESE